MIPESDLAKDALGETEHSWRKATFGFTIDGRKKRLSKSVLRSLSVLLVILIAALHMLSGFGKRELRVGSVEIEIPLIHTDSSALMPALHDEAAELLERKRNEAKANRSNGRPREFEKAELVSFSNVRGVPTGTEAHAVLSSGGSNGLVTARLTEAVVAAGETIFERGSVIFGRGQSTEDRLFIEFKKVILPDKSEVKVLAQAFDVNDRLQGLKGRKISDYAFKIAASSGLIFLGALADGMRDDVSVSPFPAHKPSLRDSALGGVTTATAEQGKAMLEKMNSEQARVEVKSETPIVIIFDETPKDDGGSKVR